MDYLKLLLAAGVVLGHALLIHEVYTGWSYLIGMAFLRSLVPTFAVVSGYCFYVTCQRGKARGWLAGLVLGYLFWTLFYAPIWVNAETGWRDVVWTLIWGTMHLWYIAGLLVAVVLIVGFLRLDRRFGAGLWPMLIAALGFALLGSGLSWWAFYRDPALPLEYARNGFTVIFPFAAMGFALAAWIARRGRDALPGAGGLWLLAGLLFGARLIEAYVGMRIYGISPIAPPEFPLLAFSAPVALFLAFLRLDLPAVAVNLSGWSASIYFLHLFVILFIRHVSGVNSFALSLVAGIGLPILVFICFDRARSWLRLRGGIAARARLQ